MQCEEFRDYVADYLAGDLADDQRSRLEWHLSSCELCRTELDGLNAVWRGLGSVPATAPDSRAMRAGLDVMLQAYRQGLDQAPAPGWWAAANSSIGRGTVKWWPSQPALQLGAALTMLIVGIVLGRQVAFAPEDPPPAPSISELRAELHDMRQMVALSLMQQQSASERLKGVSWSNQIDQPDAPVLSALLDTLMHDPNVNVRLASVDALKKFGQSQMVRAGTLQALAQQDSPLVQVALIDFMVELQEKESAGALRTLARDLSADTTVRGRAAWGLEHLE